MTTLNAKVEIDVSEALADIERTEDEAVQTADRVDNINDQSKAQTEASFLLAVHTVQRIQGLLSKAMSIAGQSLGGVGQSVMQITTSAAEVLIPLFSAQAMSGWMAVQATLASISLGISLAELPGLITEAREAQGLENTFVGNMNAALGDIAFTTG